MSTLGEPKPSLTELLYQINHVFLPPKLPQQDDTDLSHEMKLMITVNSALRKLRDQLLGDRGRELDGTIRLIDSTMGVRDSSGALHPELLRKTLLNPYFGE
jgi:hypothetical protein